MGVTPSRVVNTVAGVALVLLILAFVALNLASVARGAEAVADQRGIPVMSLLTLLLVYTVLATAIGVHALPLVTAITVANQNFILLDVAALVTYAAMDKSVVGRLLTAAAFVSCAFLLSGFGLWLLVPQFIGIVGDLKHHLRPAGAEPAA